MIDWDTGMGPDTPPSRFRFLLEPGTRLLVVAAVLAGAGESPVRVAAQPAAAIITYEASDENFPNPERGFFIQRSYNPGRKSRAAEPLSVEALRAVREKGMTLLRMCYTIPDFREAPLSADFLARVAADFALARNAGLKVIPRWAYNSGPIGAADASVERVLQHIEQLTPVLQANAGVIAFLEAGFVGAWGEWHSSTNGLFDDVPGAWWKSVNGKTRAIVAKLLEALPADRMIALRCPRFKIELYGPRPLSSTEAFSGTPQARTGA